VDVLGLSFGVMLIEEERGKVRLSFESVAQYTVVINTEEFEDMTNSTDVVEVDEGKKKGVRRYRRGGGVACKWVRFSRDVSSAELAGVSKTEVENPWQVFVPEKRGSAKIRQDTFHSRPTKTNKRIVIITMIGIILQYYNDTTVILREVLDGVEK
jgi:hypothetical protein